MQGPALLLRDIHQPPAPPWWPPAPGWWLLAGAVMVVAGIFLVWRWRRIRRQQQIVALFDTTLAAAASPADEVATMSQLLRRAARRLDPEADRLQGDAWLAFLDNHAGRVRRGEKARDTVDTFSQGPGRLLLDGPFRREVGPEEVAALRSMARLRFQQWMANE